MNQTTSPITELSDELVVAAVLQDAEQCAELIVRYEAALDRYIRRLGIKTPEDRQDVLQEIFIKAYRNLNSFDQSLKFSSWLYRIAHNEAISHFRRQSVRPEGNLVDDSESLLAFLASSELQPESTTRTRINAEALTQALDDLPEKYRDVLLLQFFEHKEYDEISDILQVPVGTVGTLLHRGKARLAKLLNTEAIDV